VPKGTGESRFEFAAEGSTMENSSSKILIVDDARDFCESLGWLLSDEGYECRVAGNGQEALNMLAEESADLILLDWEMPIMNGAGFLRRRSIRADLRAIPVLVLSAAMDIQKDTARFRASFLQKPLDYARLLTTMRSLLSAQPR
jgi:DNA-binding response OmpR family regulator